MGLVCIKTKLSKYNDKLELIELKTRHAIITIHDSFLALEETKFYQYIKINSRFWYRPKPLEPLCLNFQDNIL